MLSHPLSDCQVEALLAKGTCARALFRNAKRLEGT